MNHETDFCAPCPLLLTHAGSSNQSLLASSFFCVKQKLSQEMRGVNVAPIRWCFALSQNSDPMFDDMIRVAVSSAQRASSLRATCLYHGEPGPLAQWLQGRGVEVVFWRCSLWDEIQILVAKRGLTDWRCDAGVFLRLELPLIARKMGWSDEFVLYTDCDVMWLRDPTPLLQSLRPRLFCVAPEFDQTSWLHMNSGAMWMGMNEFARRLPALRAFMKRHFQKMPTASWDQGAMRAFFNPPHRWAWNRGIADKWSYGVLSRLPRTYAWDKLPLELNWKPYWGQNPGAIMVHFHGPKPAMRAQARRGEWPAFLQKLATDDYFAWCQKWDEHLEEALS